MRTKRKMILVSMSALIATLFAMLDFHAAQMAKTIEAPTVNLDITTTAIGGEL